MKKSFIMILVVLLVAFSAIVVFAEEAPSIHLFGNYTIRDDGLVCYTIQMLGDPICYLGFTLDSDLEIIEVQTEDTVFSAAHYASNKVICYGMGDVIADYGMVITLILAAPEPNRFYSISLSDIEGYTLREEQMTISVAMPVVEIAQEAPPALRDPMPTEPAPIEPTPTAPASTEPTNPKPSDSEVNTQSSTKPQAGISSNQENPVSPGENGIENLENSENCQKTVSVKRILTTISNVCFAIVAILVIVILVILIVFALTWKKNNNDR